MRRSPERRDAKGRSDRDHRQTEPLAQQAKQHDILRGRCGCGSGCGLTDKDLMENRPRATAWMVASNMKFVARAPFGLIRVLACQRVHTTYCYMPSPADGLGRWASRTWLPLNETEEAVQMWVEGSLATKPWYGSPQRSLQRDLCRSTYKWLGHPTRYPRRFPMFGSPSLPYTHCQGAEQRARPCQLLHLSGT
jgi:hypothetical protein